MGEKYHTAMCMQDNENCLHCKLLRLFAGKSISAAHADQNPMRDCGFGGKLAPAAQSGLFTACGVYTILNTITPYIRRQASTAAVVLRDHTCC